MVGRRVVTMVVTMVALKVLRKVEKMAVLTADKMVDTKVFQ